MRDYLSRFHFIKTQQNCLNVDISVILKSTKKLDLILESALDFQSFFFDALSVIYHLSEIKDDIQVVSQLQCILGHPV